MPRTELWYHSPVVSALLRRDRKQRQRSPPKPVSQLMVYAEEPLQVCGPVHGIHSGKTRDGASQQARNNTQGCLKLLHVPCSKHMPAATHMTTYRSHIHKDKNTFLCSPFPFLGDFNHMYIKSPSIVIQFSYSLV